MFVGMGRSLQLIYREKYSLFFDIILLAPEFVTPRTLVTAKVNFKLHSR
jgi:hypothetical protein